MGLKPRVTTHGQHADLDEHSSLPRWYKKITWSNKGRYVECSYATTNCYQIQGRKFERRSRPDVDHYVEANKRSSECN